MELILIGLCLLSIIYVLYICGKINKSFFCICSVLYLWIIAISRSLESNGDVINYINRYELLPTREYIELYNSWLSNDLKDFGFYAVAKVFADFGISYQVWIGLIALLFAISVGIFIYKNSESPLMSILILIAFYFHFTFSGLRQTVALAVILLSYEYIERRKLIKYILLVFVAAIFHSTAIVMLPAYWISKLKIGTKQIIILFICFGITIFFPGLIREFISLLAWNEAIEGYATRTYSLSWSGYIIQLLFFVFVFLFRKNIVYSKQDIMNKIDIFLNLMMIGLIFQGFSVIVAESFRISYYYSMCLISVVPTVIKSQKIINNRLILNCCFTFLFLIYILMNTEYQNFIYFW